MQLGSLKSGGSGEPREEPIASGSVRLQFSGQGYEPVEWLRVVHEGTAFEILEEQQSYQEVPSWLRYRRAIWRYASDEAAPGS